MNSKTTILSVVIFLGLVALATVVGGFVLAYEGTTIPSELIGLGGTALGAIAGILAKTTTEPAVVDAQGNAAISVAPPLTAPAPAAPAIDLTAAKDALAQAAAALEAVAPAPVEALLTDAAATHP